MKQSVIFGICDVQPDMAETRRWFLRALRSLRLSEGRTLELASHPAIGFSAVSGLRNTLFAWRLPARHSKSASPSSPSSNDRKLPLRALAQHRQ